MLPIYRRNRDACGEADALLSLGDIYRDQSSNDFDLDTKEYLASAKAKYTEAVNLYGQCGQNTPGVLSKRAEAYAKLGATYEEDDDPNDKEKALTTYESALALYRQSGKQEGVESTLESLVKFAPTEKAIEYQRELVSSSKAEGDPDKIMQALRALGDLYLKEGRARRHWLLSRRRYPFPGRAEFRCTRLWCSSTSPGRRPSQPG